MKNNRIAVVAALLSGAALVCGTSAAAQTPPPDQGDHHDGGWQGGHPSSGYRGPGMQPHYHFSHRDFAHFTAGERQNWMGGRWSHAWHNGRYGWWWLVGGVWYFYDTPVYPYPDYVSDYYVDENAYGPGYGPPMWYYCSSPPGYYPYVRRCGAPWQPVPATPPQTQNYGPPSEQPPPGYGNGPGPNEEPNGPPPDYQDQEQGPSNGPPDQPPPGYQNGPYQNGPYQNGPYDQPPPDYPGNGPNDQQAQPYGGPPPGGSD